MQANAQDLLLPSEVTDQLHHATQVERVRQDASLAQRARGENRMGATLIAAPPRDDEIQRACVFVGVSVRRSSDWDAAVVRREARIALSPFEATIFVCTNPWSPGDAVAWLAALRGCWIMTPAAFVGTSGAALLYQSALPTKRFVWVSAAARADHAVIWRCILEAMSTFTGHKWVLLHSMAGFALEKAKAERAKRSPQVLALCTAAEVAAHAAFPHVFDAAGFFKFIAKQDPARTTLGISGM